MDVANLRSGNSPLAFALVALGKSNMLIGRGRCAEIRALSDERVLKLYESRFTRERVEGFAEVGKSVHAAGIRTPQIHEVVAEGERTGVVMDRVYGETLWEAIRRSPEPRSLGQALADLHIDVHKRFISGLPSKLDEVAERIELRSTAMPDAVARAHEILSAADRSSQVLIHSDLHPANVMVNTDGELISIDWDAAQVAPASLDVARAYFLIAHWALAPGTDPIDPDKRIAVADAYLQQYAVGAGMTVDDIMVWSLPLALARYAEMATEDVPLLDAFVDSEMQR